MSEKSWKILWGKEKMLVICIFSFSHIVFLPYQRKIPPFVPHRNCPLLEIFCLLTHVGKKWSVALGRKRVSIGVREKDNRVTIDRHNMTMPN